MTTVIRCSSVADSLVLLVAVFIQVVEMHTVKFRKSRVVLLAVFLISISSLGYLLTYMSSRLRTDLSHGRHVDSSDSRRGKSTKLVPTADRQSELQPSQQSGRVNQDQENAELFRNRDINRVKTNIKKNDNKYIDRNEEEERSRSRHTDDKHVDVDSERKNAKQRAGESKDDNKYEYDVDNDDDDTIDVAKSVKNVDAATGVQRGTDELTKHRERERLSSDEHYQKDHPADRKELTARSDDYDDDAEGTIDVLPKKDDRHLDNQLPFKEERGNDDIDELGDGHRAKYDKKRYGDMVNERSRADVEQKYKEQYEAKQKAFKIEQIKHKEVD